MNRLTHDKFKWRPNLNIDNVVDKSIVMFSDVNIQIVS